MNKLWRFAPFLSPYRKSILCSILFHVFSAIFTVVSIPLIIPFFDILFDQQTEVIQRPESMMDIEGQLQFFFNNLIQNHDKQYALLIVCVSIVIVFFFKNLTRYLASYCIIPVRNGVVTDIRKNLFKKYLSLPLSFFTEEKKGNLLTKLTSDVSEVESSIINVLEASFKSPFIIAGSLFFMIYLSPKLSLFVLVLLIFVIIVIGGVSRQLRKQSSEAQAKLSEIISLAEESLGGIKVIKSYQAEETLSNSFSEKNNQIKVILNKILRRRDLSSPFSEFLGVTIVAVLLFYGSNLVFSGDLKPGTFFAFIFAFYSVIEPAKSLANAYFNVQKGLASVDRIESVFALENNISNTSGHQKLELIKKGIEFKDVSFSYTPDQELVLKDITCHIPPQKTTALVGLSGAGKTTMIDLISRYYDPTSGQITIDNIDIKDYQVSELRSAFGMVSQEPFLFNDTIENNILFGTKNKSREQVVQATKLAFAHEFVQAMDQGYDSVIGDRGVKLSGGQRQRLTLARAILKDPEIFLFDEATSALDAESEHLIQKAMDKFLRNRTAIIIAHRLSTIKSADQIIVLRKGEIIETGTHNDLLKLDGEYSKFVKLQELSH